MESLSAELTASYQCVLLFFNSTCLKYCARHEKVMPGHTKCCTCHAKSSQQTWRSDLMLQNVTSLSKSAPGPPNSSDEDVSCTAPATENASLQILCICPTPAIVFGHAIKSSRFCSLLNFDQVHNPLRLPRKTTFKRPKVLRTRQFFYTFDLEMCFAPQQRTLFSTSKRPKVLRNRQFFTLLTWKCASRHNSVHFFDIATSKKFLNPLVFLHFWLENVLRATAACNFSSLIWPHGSAPVALASLLFDPPEPQIIGKTQCFATFLPFRAPGSSFFGDFLFFWSSFFFSSLLWLFPPLLFICPNIGSLTSKLSSNICLTLVVHWLPMEELVYSKWGSITLYDLENDYISSQLSQENYGTGSQYWQGWSKLNIYILVWSLGFNQLKATGSQSVGSQEAFNSSSHVSLILGKYHQMPLTMNTLEAFAGVCYCHAEMSVWIDMNSMSHPANIEYPHYGTPKWMDFNTAGFLGVQDYKAAIDSN